MEGQFWRKGKHPTAVREFYTGKEFSEWCPTNEFHNVQWEKSDNSSFWYVINRSNKMCLIYY